jgi:hypothetical protein
MLEDYKKEKGKRRFKLINLREYKKGKEREFI